MELNMPLNDIQLKEMRRPPTGGQATGDAICIKRWYQKKLINTTQSSDA